MGGWEGGSGRGTIEGAAYGSCYHLYTEPTRQTRFHLHLEEILRGPWPLVLVATCATYKGSDSIFAPPFPSRPFPSRPFLPLLHMHALVAEFINYSSEKSINLRTGSLPMSTGRGDDVECMCITAVFVVLVAWLYDIICLPTVTDILTGFGSLHVHWAIV